jgi:nitrogen fixation protein NifU and related proteins
MDRSTPPMNDLFQELILEHYRHPRNRGELPDADISIHMNNPSCGDEVTLQLRFGEDDLVDDVRFYGQGCSISQSSLSMMTVRLKGKTRQQALALAARFTEMMHGSPEAAKDKEMGDLRALAGVSKYPVRVKCALLGFNALEEAYRQRGGSPPGS